MVEKEKRWWALYVLCAGELMIVLDTTVVNVALPSIRESLGFSEASLVWVVNAVVNTAFMMGGALGLAVLATLAEASGFRAAFIVATLFAAVAAILSAALLRNDFTKQRREAWASPSSTSK